MSDPLTEAVVTAAEHVPGDLLRLGARAVEPFPSWSPGAAVALANATPAPAYRRHAELVSRCWAEAPALPGTAVAASLRAAVAAVASSRATNQVSLVYTGPQVRAAGFPRVPQLMGT